MRGGVPLIVQMKLSLRDEGEKRLLPEYAYGIYSDLLACIPEEYVDFLHEPSESRPLCHYLLPNREDAGKGKFFLTLFDGELVSAFAPAVLATEEFSLHKYHCRLMVEQASRKTIRFDQIAQACFGQDKTPDSYVVRFLSPTVFRTQDQYALYPTVELILKSAMNRFHLLDCGLDVVDGDALEQLVQRARITDYSLRSRRYSIKDTTVYGFSGWVRLTVRGPLPLRQLFRLLLSALPYTGVGGKTALGMGGCSVEEF